MLFILSNRAMATNFAFLLGAAISLLAGLILIWSNPPPPPPPSERFSVLKRKMINQIIMTGQTTLPEEKRMDPTADLIDSYFKIVGIEESSN